MRRTALVLLITLGSSLAVAQSPPSVTLKRAIKLYDKKDFFSASIEAKKVIDGGTGDSPDNVERARFFMAKTMFQMKFHVPAFVMFTQIIQANGAYRGASFKWIAGLRNVMPDSYLVPALDTMTAEDLGDPSLVSARNDLEEIQKAKTAPAPDLHAIARDVLGCTHPELRRMRELLDKLHEFDDNVELLAAVRRAVHSGDPLAPTLDLAMEKAPAVRDARRWVAELRAELELLQLSDRAWQTTIVAAEILQEATVQYSVGEADMGAHLHALIDAMDAELATIGGYTTPPDRCTHSAAPTLAGSPSTSPMVVDPPRQGCGCSTGGSPDGALLVGLLAVAFRRKSRAASRTRSPRA